MQLAATPLFPVKINLGYYYIGIYVHAYVPNLNIRAAHMGGQFQLVTYNGPTHLLSASFPVTSDKYKCQNAPKQHLKHTHTHILNVSVSHLLVVGTMNTLNPLSSSNFLPTSQHSTNHHSRPQLEPIYHTDKYLNLYYNYIISTWTNQANIV